MVLKSNDFIISLTNLFVLILIIRNILISRWKSLEKSHMKAKVQWALWVKIKSIIKISYPNNSSFINISKVIVKKNKVMALSYKITQNKFNLNKLQKKYKDKHSSSSNNHKGICIRISLKIIIDDHNNFLREIIMMTEWILEYFSFSVFK